MFGSKFDQYDGVPRREGRRGFRWFQVVSGRRCTSFPDEKMGTAAAPHSPAGLRLSDFEGDFSADDFIHSILESAGLGGSGPGSSGGFDAERILAALESGGIEVAALRVEAQGQLRGAIAAEEQLMREHVELVRTLRRQADQVLAGVTAVEERVATVGGKAVEMGQELDKLENERRRAKEASEVGFPTLKMIEQQTHAAEQIVLARGTCHP